MLRRVPVHALAALAGVLAVTLAPAWLSRAQQPALDELVQAYLWSEDPAQVAQAATALRSDASLAAASRMRFHDVEEVVRRGRPVAHSPSAIAGEFAREDLSVELSDGRSLPVLVQLPPGYSTARNWPLLLAMHGGPPQQAAQARAGAERMLKVWKTPAAEAGWIVVSPAMTTVVAVGPRTEERLPYEVLRPEQARRIIAAAARRYRVDPNRIVSTGISLGSNFSIAFAASTPDRFAAIVPVSTEGDSRELLLRNLMHVPVYVLEGTRDKNIRAIDGPRTLAALLRKFGYDVTYREFDDRAHEGFEDHYPDVLRWLADRPRAVYPREVLRVPHPAIMPAARRVHWIEADTRQALVHARVAGDNRIEIAARWARHIRVFLHDRLVDLDRDVEIRINGARAFAGKVERSIPFALEQVKQLDDPGRLYAAAVTVTVSRDEAAEQAGRMLWRSIEPGHQGGPLSFWEMYATRALEERLPALGVEGREAPGERAWNLAPEAVAIQVSAVRPGSALAAAGLLPGDFLVEIEGEPFFAGRGLSVLRDWLMRELTTTPRPYRIGIRRSGEPIELTATLALGPYRS